MTTKRVLWVEDEIGSCSSFINILKKEGFDVTVVSNKSEATEYLAKDSIGYNLIILDLIIPFNKNGFRINDFGTYHGEILAKEILSRKNIKAPLVVFSVLEEKSNVAKELYDAGINKFIEKGRISPENFRDKIFEIINSPSKEALSATKVPFEICREFDIRFEEETILINKIPVDNRKSLNDIEIEQELSNKLENNLLINISNDVSGKVSSNLLQILQSELASRISKIIGYNHLDSKTLGHKAILRAKAGEYILYEINCKKKVRRSKFEILVDGSSIVIPINCICDIEYAVKSEPIGCEPASNNQSLQKNKDILVSLANELTISEFVELSDGQWNFIKPILDQNSTSKRNQDNNRKIINGIIYVRLNRCSWKEMPPKYGSYRSARTKFKKWKNEGVWDNILEAAQGQGYIIEGLS